MDDLSPAQLRLYAMNLLARREYTRQELIQKLSRKSFDLDLINQVVSLLQTDDLQSDQRFAEAFTRMRLRQGKGKRLVAMELKQRGVSPQLIQEFVSNDEQWRESLSALIERRFSGQLASDPQQKAKQLRYLQSRGFTYEQIQAVVRQSDLD
jgi:regulatory protein